MQSFLSILLLAAGMQVLPVLGDAQPTPPLRDSVIYKSIDDTTSLGIHFIYPENVADSTRLPLIVFYHGGGWINGNWKHFLPQARHFSKRGYLSALVEYRVQSRHGSTPFESLIDAKSAMRYLKANRRELRIDTSRIVAAGGSAGGHLAAAVTMVDGYNDPRDDTSISTRVAALALFNPVLDNGPDGYGYERVGEAYRTFSPYHQSKGQVPPTLILLGTEDNLIPVSTMQEFCADMDRAGRSCTLVLYEDKGHGFFNNEPYLGKTIDEMERFLKNHLPEE